VGRPQLEIAFNWGEEGFGTRGSEGSWGGVGHHPREPNKRAILHAEEWGGKAIHSQGGAGGMVDVMLATDGPSHVLATCPSVQPTAA
jgi:hypothetical protein